MKALDTNWTATVMHLKHKSACSNSKDASLARELLHKITSVTFVLFLGRMESLKRFSLILCL